MDHHGNRLVSVEVGLSVQASQAKEGFLRVLGPSLSDKPPRRFWRQQNTYEERNRPHPLERIRDSIRPLICAAQHGFDNANTNHLTETPAKVHISRKVTSQCYRTDFRGIGNGERLENSPRLQNVSWDSSSQRYGDSQYHRESQRPVSRLRTVR